MKILATISLLLGLAFTANAAVEVNGIAAKVNGRTVTKNEVAFMLAPVRAYLSSNFPRKTPRYYSELKKAKEKVLEELINRELIIFHFKDRGAQLPDHVIESEIRRKIRKDYNGSDRKFRAELKSKGLSYEKFKELTRRQLIVQAMRSSQFKDTPPPTGTELRSEYNKISDTLRDVTKDRCTFEKMYIPKVDTENLAATPETQLQLAESIVKKLKNGDKFAPLAIEHSRDAFAEDGGKQKDISRTDLAPVIGSMIFQEDTGKVLGPLEDGRGYHIIRCTSKKLGPAPGLGDSKVKQLVEENVRREKTAVQYERWIQKLKRNAMIKRYM